jgi:hypothetical protein
MHVRTYILRSKSEQMPKPLVRRRSCDYDRKRSTGRPKSKGGKPANGSGWRTKSKRGDGRRRRQRRLRKPVKKESPAKVCRSVHVRTHLFR